MPNLITDQLETLEMSEENGVVRSLKLLATIEGLTSNTYAVLIEAYKQVGLPTPGTFLVDPDDPLNPSWPIPPGKDKAMAMLLLAKRNFKLRANDKKTVDIVLDYQHFMEGDNQNLTPGATSPNDWKVPASSIVYGKNRASVQQTKSNYYDTRVVYQLWTPTGTFPVGKIVEYKGLLWKAMIDQIWAGPPTLLVAPPGPTGTALGAIWSVVDESTLAPTVPTAVRRQIIVGHQFPITDGDYPGRVQYQTGEITIMQPNDNFKLHGQVFVRNPRSIKIAVLGAINSIPWMDGKSYTWMCTEVAWEPLYVSWQWKVTFEFQHNEDSWLPAAIFHDGRAGKPPPNLVPGFGFRQLHRQKELDFENYFRVIFGCAPEAGA